jgi:hypothetical protein
VKKRLLYSLLFVVFLLAIAHIVSPSISPTFREKFDLDQEGNVPTWFSTILLFWIALNSYRIFKSNTQVQNTVRLSQIFWGSMSAAFLFLSLDEGAQLHELFVQLHLPHWFLIYAPFIILFLFLTYYYLFCENCGRELRTWLGWGFVLYILGAFFFELITYLLSPLSPALMEAEFVVEESLEMVGAIFILVGTYQHLEQIEEQSP